MKLKADVKERLTELADADGRSLSNLVEKILTDFVKEHASASEPVTQ